MGLQPPNVGDPKMAPAVDGRRQLEAVLWIELRRRGRVGHGIFDVAWFGSWFQRPAILLRYCVPMAARKFPRSVAAWHAGRPFPDESCDVDGCRIGRSASRIFNNGRHLAPRPGCPVRVGQVTPVGEPKAGAAQPGDQLSAYARASV